MPQNKPVPAPERVVLRRRLAVLLWRAVAVLGLTLGLLGVVLPVVPTVPFLILSAWAASKGWPAFEIWLLNHRLFGPPIVQWRERGAVPRRTKWFSTLMMAASGIGMQFFKGRLSVLRLQKSGKTQGAQKIDHSFPRRKNIFNHHHGDSLVHFNFPRG